MTEDGLAQDRIRMKIVRKLSALVPGVLLLLMILLMYLGRFAIDCTYS